MERGLLNGILKGKIEGKGLKTIIEEYRKILGDINSLKTEIISDPEAAFQNIFINTDDDEIEFYELNQLYKKAVSDIGIEDLADPSEFDNWFKKVFACIQESIALPDSPEDIDHIRVMSLHSSKGLSAKFVVLCSMIDHLMPFIPSDVPKDLTAREIEEQRRLFYVAITRCKASNDYPGRLIVSSFLSIYGLDAVRMGINVSNVKNQVPVQSTRFLKDFGRSAPTPILGSSLLNND